MIPETDELLRSASRQSSRKDMTATTVWPETTLFADRHPQTVGSSIPSAEDMLTSRKLKCQILPPRTRLPSCRPQIRILVFRKRCPFASIALARRKLRAIWSRSCLELRPNVPSVVSSNSFLRHRLQIFVPCFRTSKNAVRRHLSGLGRLKEALSVLLGARVHGGQCQWRRTEPKHMDL